MGGTKIFVLQMKQITKALVIAGVALAVALLLLIFAGVKGTEDGDMPSAKATYNPGVYSSEIILQNKPVVVSVEVNDEKIISVKLDEMEEMQQIFYPLIKPTMETISKEIVRTQTLDISTTTDAKATEEILITAIREALDKAVVKQM